MGVFRPLNFINRLASDVRLMLRRPERLQFAALCYRWNGAHDGIEILLITSRDTGRWVIPKGWPMEGKLAHQAAAQEALEEVGVIGVADEKSAGNFLYLKTLDAGVKVPCKVQVHALEVSDFVSEFKEKGQRRKKWFTCKDAAERVQEPGLKELILSFEASVLAGSGRRAARG
jgi:8-oxo-dGTP pyrophosphatase MutT (NUDIX family)